MFTIVCGMLLVNITLWFQRERVGTTEISAIRRYALVRDRPPSSASTWEVP